MSEPVASDEVQLLGAPELAFNEESISVQAAEPVTIEQPTASVELEVVEEPAIEVQAAAEEPVVKVEVVETITVEEPVEEEPEFPTKSELKKMSRKERRVWK